MLDDSMYSVDVVDKLYGLVKVGIMMIIIMVEIYLFFEIQSLEVFVIRFDISWY